MWGPTTAPPQWRHSVEVSTTISCDDSHLKPSSDGSILLQGPIGLGSGEEDVLQTEKAESEGEAEYNGGTVIPVPAETAADGSNNCDRNSSTNCFSLVRAVKPERTLPLPPGGQNEGLLGCHDSSSTGHGHSESSRLAIHTTALTQKLKVSPAVTSEGSQCPPPVTTNETSPPCSPAPNVSSATPVLPYAVPLGSSGTAGLGGSGARPWTSNAPRLPMVSIGGEARGPSVGSVGCFISSVFLGTNSHTPILPGGAAAASSALPAAVGNRFSGLGCPPLLHPGISVGGSTGALSSWPQHPKQQQQPAMCLRPHLVHTTGPQPTRNMPVILTALRRHLRSLIRIMYNKQYGRTHFESAAVQEEASIQKERDRVMYRRESGSGCGVSVSLNEEHPPASCCLKGLINGSQAEFAQCSAAVDMQDVPSAYKTKAQEGSLIPPGRQGNGLRNSPNVNSQLRPPSPEDEVTESQDDTPETAAVSCTVRRGTATVQLAGSSSDSPLSHLSSVEGAAESWEGQRCFHEEHLDACSLSELSEYLQIFSSFLSLSLSEVSRQAPATLQHVRLQLLLLRNSHQQQPHRQRQAKQILQRWPPGLQSSAVGGSDGDDDEPSLNSCAEAALSPVDACLHASASGATRQSVPFGSTNLSFLSSFSSSPNSQVDVEAPSIATSAVQGEKTANGGAVSAGECEAGPQPTGVRTSEFPSSSVDAFSVDGPPSNGSNAATIGTPTTVADCPVPPPVPTTFVTATANDQPGVPAGLPPCKEKLPLQWNSDCGGAAGAATVPAAGLRWAPLTGTAIGIRLHNLIGGTSLGLSNSLSLSGSSGGAIQHSTETPAGPSLTANSSCGVGGVLEGGTATLALAPGPLEWIRDGAANTTSNQPMGVPVSPYAFLSNGHSQSPENTLQFARTVHSTRGSSNACATSPADLGLVIPADGLGQGRRQCSSKRASDRGSKGKGCEAREDGTRGGARGSKDTSRKASSAVTPIPQVTIGLVGPPGGAFNLAKSNNQEFILPKSDFSASRVARLSRRAMELPYVHGVRFEAANFAWVAQMRGEARRFLVKKHGFVKSRLCAIEKIETWRAALSPEALASELKAEQDVLAMVPNMCPEEAYPEAMQAVEESLRLKFQRGTIMSCRSSGGASIGLKRQRNLCLDTDRELSKANRSHDTFLEQFLVQQQQVMAAQHLISQPGTQPDVLRHQYQLPQSQFVQASHQHFAENPQQHLLTQDHLLRAIASPGSSADPTPGREEPEQPQQQQIVMALQGLRTRGQNQQPLLSHQLPSVGPTVHGMSLQQQIMGANSQQARTTPE